ncbi:exodeoxyribonuclease VII small subunit [bacterium]|nr:exodeoxyribonuclease VII small subunit [bacterium]
MTEQPTTPFNFEAALARLEEIAQLLEKGDLPLDEMEKCFVEGVELARRCEARLSQVEERVETLLAEEDGSVKRVPFTEDEE